jgi:hypothetical protein
VIRIHTGGFADDWPGTIADPAISLVGDTVRLGLRRAG